MADYSFEDFKRIIERLRAKDGCPWDREQTHESLRQAMLEECYEAIDALDRKDIPNLREELGDILLQVVMHSIIAEEAGEFTMDDVISDISRKMVYRHPHVFGNGTASTADQVLENWEELKKKEKAEQSVSEGLLRVARALPANVRAEKVQKKAAKAGMEFESTEQVLGKVKEELAELEEARDQGNLEQIEEEYGDLMFSMINLSRFLRINAENSLTKATDKFINRFVSVERLAAAEGRKTDEMSAAELDALWERVK